jgi:hypothetical protein
MRIKSYLIPLTAIVAITSAAEASAHAMVRSDFWYPCRVESDRSSLTMFWSVHDYDISGDWNRKRSCWLI